MTRASHPLLRTIGLTIRSRRRERGLSQESLAALAHIDRSYMSSVERGLRNVSVLNIARIAAALDVPMWELLRQGEARPVVIPRVIDAEGMLGVGRNTAVPVSPAAPREYVGIEWEPGRYLSLG